MSKFLDKGNEMVKTRKELRDYITYERKKYCLSKFSAFAKYLLSFEVAVIWHWQKRLRITEYHYNAGHKIRYVLSLVKLNRLSINTGLHIPINVCGKGLKIMHLGSILCNPRTKIGEDCSIHINTAFVARGTNGKCPVIGNNCVIGIGSTILGGGFLPMV